MFVKSRDVQPLHVLGAERGFLFEGHRTGDVWSLMEVTLAQDAGPPPHYHERDEAYFVIEGDVQFVVGDRHFTTTSGDFVYTPGSVVHGFRGGSPQPARLLIFNAPAHADAFFRRVDGEVKELPRDLPKVLEIGEDTGIRIMRPA
jgi:mannose-6-phosphate isomerase-like protein (cupin superfamily)